MRVFDLKHTITVGTTVAIMAVAAAGCRPPEEASGSPPAQTAARVAVPVATAPVLRQDLARSVTVTGPVEPVRVITVSAQTSGVVRSVAVEEGDAVARGDLLVELDDRETRAQLRRAQALLASAKAAYERSGVLLQDSFVSQVEYEQARATYEVAESDVSLWETRLSFTRITAPTAGVIVTRTVEAGGAVSTNQPLFEIADVSLMVVRTQVSELDVVHLTQGTEVSVVLDAFPAEAFRGTIRRIFPSADPASRLVPVEIALRTMPRAVRIRSGFLARVTLPVDRRSDALVIPASAVAVAEDGPYVFVVEADTLIRRLVDLGLSTGGWVESTAGVDEGDLVVTSGLAALRPGMSVRVQPEETQ